MTKTDKILGNLPTFINKDPITNTYNLITSFEEDLNSIQTQIENLKTSIQLSTAVGDELNSIGALFLLPRQGGETDDNYRDRIKGYWPGFSGGGTVDSIKTIINRMTGIDESEITIVEYPEPEINVPLKFNVYVNIEGGTDIVTLRSVIESAKAAGTYVKSIFNYIENPELMVADTAETDINILH